MSNLAPLMSTGKDDWETPDDLFADYDNLFHFVLDAAANSSNHKCPRWYGPGGEKEDALVSSWPLEEGNIWLNPPYSRGNQRKFVEKAIAEVLHYNQGGTLLVPHSVVALLPADTSTKLFHELIMPYKSGEIEFLKGRIQFKGAKGKPKFASMVVVF